MRLWVGTIRVQQPAVEFQSIMAAQRDRLLGLLEPPAGLKLLGHVEFDAFRRLLVRHVEHRTFGLGVQREHEHDVGGRGCDAGSCGGYRGKCRSHAPDNASVCGDDVMAILIDDVVRTSHINLPIWYSPSYVIIEIIPNFVKDRTLSVAERTFFTKWRTIS